LALSSLHSVPEARAGKDHVAIAGGGKIYVFDSTALLAGPVASSSFGPATASAGAIATWVDTSNTRWIAAPAPRGIVALKVTDVGGKPGLAAGWTSRDLASPLSPVVIGGVLFTATPGTRAVGGVLYAIDGSTGKELYTSGRSITGVVRGSLSAGGGNVFVPTADSTFYAFGFAIEK
jgi:hypothetical protein